MRTLIALACCCALASVASAQDKQWTHITGQVVFPANKPIPPRNPLNVNVDKAVCLAKGAILDESVIVNPKNRGVKNVVVFLRPDANNANAAFKADEIHPADAKRKAQDVVIDQPCCMFTARVTCARVGDTIVVKNPAAVVHNFFWSSANNGDHNPNIPANQQWKMPKPLVEERTPIQYKCTVHPWMTGYVRVFDRDQERARGEVPHRVLARERREGRRARALRRTDSDRRQDAGAEADGVRGEVIFWPDA
jgi:plastocyanin